MKISIQELPAAGHQIRWWEGKEASEWMADIIRPRSSVFLPSAFRLLAPPDRSRASSTDHGPLLKRRRPTLHHHDCGRMNNHFAQPTQAN